MKIVFLGTSAMVPTRERNLMGLLINYKNENILIDCGEGTQRQMKLVKISPTKITKILLTHLHGDHIFGLPGLLQTMASSGYNKTLEIYGPIGTKKYLSFIINNYINEDKISIKVKEISGGTFFKGKEFSLIAEKLKHRIACLGYSFIENNKIKINTKYTKKFGLTKHPLLGNLQKGKDITYNGKKITANLATTVKKGKKITVILDTETTNNIIKFAKDSDILVCEATYLNNLKDHAKLYKHLTAKQAAEIAKKSKSKKLILTHFSQRYKLVKDLEEEAKKTFKNTHMSKDLAAFSF
ncbi:MAG: ribonuclease Z [Nanoarchaeota archaeon]|nr:ribonuclease Z [Nanoarchaeota archaeon]MBU1444941.1 ribonuclease Z [Nanoarchaeota archaeon]MBU2420293.1 ribonuclease Z [Nanoarchaeota archaeon]MBU2475695.1 ribonuclease Z [Nanoarchaeota archaeon]MBU3941199.1 ribonuclease Z [Nanoarchaeota archaeon]